MKKPVVILIILGVLVGAMGAGTYLWMKKKKEAPLPVTQQEEQTRLLDWKDPNGFTFQYPEGVTIDKHDEDKENYAHLEMTHPAHSGRLVVWAKDTTAIDVAAWVKTEKSFLNASIVDTTLGGEPAKKILPITPANKIIVGTIFDKILWYIEVEPGEGDYWQKTFDTIVGSFKFTPLAGESSPRGSEASVDDEVMVDEEEVIE